MSDDWGVPHGMVMSDRSYNTEGYRFGMNGQEKVDEITSGNYTAEYWEYDARIGRRWNIDPVTLAWQSPYATFDDNPIAFSDPSGAVSGDPKGAKENPIELDEVEVKASPQTLKGKFKLALNRLKEHAKEVVERVKTGAPKVAVLVGGAADAYVSDMLLKPDPFLKPSDWGGGEYAEIAKRGYSAGHTAAAVQGVGEMATGDGMIVGGGTVSLSGVGATVGVPAAAAGAGLITHGALMTNVATANLVKMQMEESNNEAHDSKDTNGSNETKAGEESSKNFGKDAKKMTPDEIGEFLGKGKNWHKTNAKSSFLAKYKKQLKGDTNADFWFDKNTNDVYLKSNKSGNWIKTGLKF